MRELGLVLVGITIFTVFFVGVIYPNVEYKGYASNSSCTGECYKQYVIDNGTVAEQIQEKKEIAIAKAESGIVDVFEAYEKKFGESKSVFSTKQEDGTRFQIGNQPGNTVDNSTLLQPKGLGTGTNVDKEPFTSKVTPVEGGRKTNDDLKNEFANGMSSTTPASDPATMGMTEATGQQLVAVQQEQNALLKSQLRATKELNA
jgi:hypothetical protein